MMSQDHKKSESKKRTSSSVSESRGKSARTMATEDPTLIPDLWSQLTEATRNKLEAEAIDRELTLMLTKSDMIELQICMGDRLRIANFKVAQTKQTDQQSAETSCSQESEAPTPSALPAPGPPSITTTSAKHSNKLPSSLPKYDPKNSKITAKDFLDKFSLVLSAEDYNPDKWHYALALAIKGSGSQWANRVILQDATMNWSKAKELFLQHFTWADEERDCWTKYTSIAQQHDESIREYTERFLYLVERLQRDQKDKGTIFHFSKGMREPFKTSFATAAVTLKPADLQTAINIAVELDDTTCSKARKPDRHDEASKSNPRKEANKSKQKKIEWMHFNGTTYRKGGCPHHPHLTPKDKGFHKAMDCKNPKQSKPSSSAQPSVTPKKPEETKESPSSTVTCWNCNEVGHTSNRCTKPKMKAIKIFENYFKDISGNAELESFQKDPSEEVFSEPNPAEHMEFLATLTGEETLWNMSIKTDSTPIHHITFQMEIEGIVVTAFYDTGCGGMSYIDQDFCKVHNIPIIPTEGDIELGQKGVTIPRIGQTLPLQIRIPGRKISATFEVMDLDYKVYVGVALGARLGIGLTNLPIRSVQSAVIEEPEPDIYPSFTDSSIPHPQQEMVISGIGEELNRNSLVSGFCPHPESVVRLNLLDDRPKFIPQYRIAERFHQAVEDTINEWKRRGVIVEIPISNTNNPLNVVQKKDPATGLKSTNPQHIRVNFDGRDLNKRMPTYQYELPRIAEIFECLAGSKIFTTFDLKDAFCSFRILEKDTVHMAFTWNRHHYKWIGAPFGLKVLSFQFQKVMNMILHEHQEYSMVFIDDIIVHSNSPEEHLLHLKMIIETLTRFNLKINRLKSNIAYQALYLLGHKVSGEGIEIDRRKLLGIESWPAPNCSNIEHYLGLFNYFRIFIPRYSTVVAPLDRIRKNFLWESEQQQSWDTIRQLLVSAPLLHHPDFTKNFYTASDASKTGISAVIFQKKDEAIEDVMDVKNTLFISFAARSLQKAERRYSATKREALAIVFALIRFKHYLLGRNFKHFTDHKSLTWLFQLNDDNRTTNTWIDVIMEYPGLEPVYLPGILNIIPDHLSRIFSGVEFLQEGSNSPENQSIANKRFELQCKKSQSNVFTRTDYFIQLKKLHQFDYVYVDGKNKGNPCQQTWGMSSLIKPGYLHIEKTIRHAQRKVLSKEQRTVTLIIPKWENAPWYNETVHYKAETIPEEQYSEARAKAPMMIMLIDKESTIQLGASPANPRFAKNTILQDDYPCEIIEDPQVRKEKLAHHHELGHYGGLALAKSIIQAGIRWPSLYRDSADYVAKCNQCQRYTIGRKGFHPLTPIMACLPMDHISFDLFQMKTSTNGYNYVLIIVDIATRYVFLRELQTKSSILVARELFNLFCNLGFPRILQSDNGKEFVNKILNKMKTVTAQEHRTITPYHPRANGSSERYVRTIKDSLLKQLNGADTNWVEILPMTQYCANIRVSNVHHSSPFSLFFGRKFNYFGDHRTAITAPEDIQALESRMKFLSEIVYPTMEARNAHAQRLRSIRFDDANTLINLPEGSEVMTVIDVKEGGKSAQRYAGPYRVSRRTRGGSYILVDSDGTTLPRRYAPSQIKPLSPQENDDPSYEVDQILDDKMEEGKRWYYVRWKDYGPSDDSWICETDFDSVEVIQKYWHDKPTSSQPAPGNATRSRSAQRSTTSVEREQRSKRGRKR